MVAVLAYIMAEILATQEVRKVPSDLTFDSFLVKNKFVCLQGEQTLQHACSVSSEVVGRAFQENCFHCRPFCHIFKDITSLFSLDHPKMDERYQQM